jgi:hypothetical protein
MLKYIQKGGSISEIQATSPVQNIIMMDETTVSEALEEDINNIIIFPIVDGSLSNFLSLRYADKGFYFDRTSQALDRTIGVATGTFEIKGTAPSRLIKQSSLRWITNPEIRIFATLDIGTDTTTFKTLSMLIPLIGPIGNLTPYRSDKLNIDLYEIMYPTEPPLKRTVHNSEWPQFIQRNGYSLYKAVINDDIDAAKDAIRKGVKIGEWVESPQIGESSTIGGGTQGWKSIVGLAAKIGNPHMLNLLINQNQGGGWDSNYICISSHDMVQNDKESLTPLMFACREGNYECALLLISKGAVTNIQQKPNWGGSQLKPPYPTALSYALQNLKKTGDPGMAYVIDILKSKEREKIEDQWAQSGKKGIACRKYKSRKRKIHRNRTRKA